MMTETEQFITLADNEKDNYLKALADIMKKHINEIVAPTSEDIEKVLVDIAAHLPVEKALLSSCKKPNWHCSSCPFGVYLHKSGKMVNGRPVCLVWISFFKKNLHLSQKDIKVN